MSEGVGTLLALESKLARRQYLANTKFRFIFTKFPPHPQVLSASKLKYSNACWLVKQRENNVADNAQRV